MKIVIILMAMLCANLAFGNESRSVRVWMAPNLKSVINLSGGQLVSGLSEVSIFKYYCDTVLRMGAQRLSGQVTSLKRKGIKIALECAPLSEPGYQLESFGEPLKILKAVDRVVTAGGDVSFVALDEPVYYAHYENTGKRYVGWGIGKICSNAVANINPVFKKYPEISFGLIESINRVSPGDVFEFMSCFSELTGRDFSFFHSDVIWSRPDAWQSAKAWSQIMARKGLRYGVIFNSTYKDADNNKWIGSTESNINTYFKYGGKLDEAIIQSWHKEPQSVYPGDKMRSISELPLSVCERFRCGK